MHSFVKLALKLAGSFSVLILTAVTALTYNSFRLPDLKAWHRAELVHEFDAAAIAAMTGLEDYLARERLLFSELSAEVYNRVLPEDELMLNRYYPGSQVHPPDWPQDFNQTIVYEPADPPRCGVLIAHGLTDSPYSGRHIMTPFSVAGCYGVSLRMPGHGTVPASLTRARFEDWQAAVALGVRAVRDRIGAQAPLFLVGYSNGGALVVDYALGAITQPDQVQVQGLFLFSPMIGVTPFSRFAQLGQVLERFEFFEKYKWLDVQPEYDPYKYNSFPKQAGYETFRATRAIRGKIEGLVEQGLMDRMPPVVTFQSLVDATVSTPAVVEELYARLDGGGHELVLFDLNRYSEVSPFLVDDHLAYVENLFRGPALAYDLTLVGNAERQSRGVAARRRVSQQTAVTLSELGLTWPAGTYSLAHVALVFAPDDELYGTAEASRRAGMPALGALNPRGERGVTRVSIEQLMRIRHNPFFTYLEERMQAAIEKRLDS